MRIVDTSVFIDAERRHAPAIERIGDLLLARDLAVSVVTVFELTCGGTTPRRLLAHYAELFGREALVLPVTHAAALLASEAARACGWVKAPDALIAGTALEHGVPVVTSDADFRQLQGLSVEWLPRAPLAHEPTVAYGARERTSPRIRSLREAAGLRSVDVAAAAGMARSNYARLEAGRHQPGLDTLRRVAAALGARVADLLP